MLPSHDLRSLSDDELLTRTHDVARREQSLTLEVIAHLEEVARRRLFAARGYASLFDYAVRALGYSEPAASQRVAAMRLARAVPEARGRMESGELPLSTAAAVERFIRREENETRTRLTPEDKGALVAEVAGKSTREAERVLAARAQAVGMAPRPERARPLSAKHTELRIVADAALMARIERTRELKGAHVGLGEIFTRALDAYLDREDPLRRKARARQKPNAHAGVPTPDVRAAGGVPTSEVAPARVPAPEVRRATRYIPVTVRRAAAVRSGGRCEYHDPKTGRRCEGRHALQWDHIRPHALGGAATRDNIRQLCPAHNRWAAIQALGPRVMGRHMAIARRE